MIKMFKKKKFKRHDYMIVEHKYLFRRTKFYMVMYYNCISINFITKTRWFLVI